MENLRKVLEIGAALESIKLAELDYEESNNSIENIIKVPCIYLDEYSINDIAQKLISDYISSNFITITSTIRRNLISKLDGHKSGAWEEITSLFEE